MTYNQLIANAVKVNVDRAVPATDQDIVLLDINPHFTTKVILFNKEIRGTKKGVHQQQVFFKQLAVSRNEETDPNLWLPFENEKSGLAESMEAGLVNVGKPSLSRSTVQVRCSCPDFQYTFAPYCAKSGALYGSPPPMYVKKTDRPSRNPGGLPGVCKHLIVLGAFLADNGFVLK